MEEVELTGVFDCSKAQRRYYIQQLQPQPDCLQSKNNLPTQLHSTSITNLKFNLCLSNSNIDAVKEDEAISSSDYLFSRYKIYPQNNELSPDDLIKDGDHLVCVRGVSGSGKTLLLNNLISKWSKGEMSRSIELIYYFHCRELCDFMQDNFVDFINIHQPITFPKLSLYEQLSVANSTLIIFDGIDQLSKHNTVLLYEMINNDAHGFKVCLSGRPNAIFDLEKHLVEEISTKLVDIRGFDVKEIQTFIESYYASQVDHRNKVQTLMQQIQANELLQSIASIPLMLPLLCCLNDEKDGLDFISSDHLLLAYVTLIILRQNLEKLGLQNQSFEDLCKNEDVLGILRKISELSYFALADGKIMLDEKDFANEDNRIENSGFVFKHNTILGDAYQLVYPILTDFLAGLHLFLQGQHGIRQLFHTTCPSSAWNTLPFLLSFVRKYEGPASESPDLMLTLIDELQLTSDPGTWFQTAINWLKGSYKKDPQELICKLFYHHFVYHDRLYFDINQSWYVLLATMYEYKHVPQFIIDNLSGASSIRISIQHHHILKYLRFLFDHISCFEKGDIMETFICMKAGFITSEEVEMMQFILKNSFSLNYNTPISGDTELYSGNTNNIMESKHGLDSVLSFIPYTNSVTLNCETIPDESINMLLNQFSSQDEVLLDFFKVTHCTEEKLIKIIEIITYLDTFQIENCNVTIKCIQKLSDKIFELSVHQNTTPEPKVLDLDLSDCQLTDTHLQILSQPAPYITSLNLCNNPEITNIGIKSISQKIYQHIAIQRESLLKELLVSHLTDDAVLELIPVISTFEYLHLLECDKLSIKVPKAICKKVKETKTGLSIWFHENKNMSKEDILKVFDDVGIVDVYIAKSTS